MYSLDKNLERAIISAAKIHGVKRLILFGSRARGTNHERSDIDLAATGGDFLKFSATLAELNTLLAFDVTNPEAIIDENFRAEIDRDGIILYEEVSAVRKKFDAFNKSLEILSRANRDSNDEIYLMGIIGQFNLTFELSWKALKEILLLNGVLKARTGSPREILMAGYEFYFLTDEEVWLDMLKRRNQVAHIYDAALADELIKYIFDKYLAAFVNLRDELERRLPADT